MVIAPAASAILELTTLSIHGTIPKTPAPFPDSSFLRQFQKDLTNQSFIESAKEALTCYSNSNSVLIQMVMDTISSPPPAHFSFKCVPSFIQNNLPWLLALNKPISIEIYATNTAILDQVEWPHLLDWATKYNIPLFVTSPTLSPRTFRRSFHKHVA